MANNSSHLNSQIHHKDALLPSVYTSILYSLNNFSYHFQKFSFTGFIQQLTENTSQNAQQSTYFLMGKRFRNFRQCLQVQKDLIFFSYRKNFKITETITSDFGWGCLLRVGQMALAQALRLHFNHINIEVPKNQIIQPFLQTGGSTACYSIQKLTKQAKILWNKDIGQWYSQIEMLSVIQEIHKKNPMQGAQDFTIKIYNESLDLVELKKELQTSDQAETPQSDKNEDQKLWQEDTLQVIDEKIDLTRAVYRPKTIQIQKKTIMVVVNTTLGDKQIDENEYSKLLNLMQLPIFIGCIAGVKGKAKYLTGKLNKNVSFFDPHLVQEAQFNVSSHLNTESYVCEDYLLMSKDKLSPQISICFFIKDTKDLQILKAGIDKIQQNQKSLSDHTFINYQQVYVNPGIIEPKTRFAKVNSEQIQILQQYPQEYFDSSSFTIVQ